MNTLNTESTMIMIARLVADVITIYMREDYDYTASMIAEGRRVSEFTCVKTIEDEVEFIKSNNLVPKGMTDRALRTAASEIMVKIHKIQRELERKHIVNSILSDEWNVEDVCTLVQELNGVIEDIMAD